MSKRVYITLPDRVHQQLEELARFEGRATANLASYFVQKEVEKAVNQQPTRLLN